MNTSHEQLALGLEFSLGDPVAVGSLREGERFLRTGGAEGQVLKVNQGSATVRVLDGEGRWERTQWSLSTVVRKLKA